MKSQAYLQLAKM